MDALELLHARIADFTGYSDDHARRRSDEFVRSYLGEALASIIARYPALAPEVEARIDALLLRVGFADQKSFASHNVIAGLARPDDHDGVAAVDAVTVEMADRAGATDEASLAPFLDEISSALDRREAAMRAAAMPRKTP